MAGSPRFGDWLNEQMRLAGIKSLAELARRLDVSESLVGKWSRGEGAPGSGNIDKLAKEFGETPENIARLAGLISGEVRPDNLSFEDVMRLAQLKSPWFLPIEGIASAGPGAPQDGTWRPAEERGRNLKAVEITGDCLSPEVVPGDVVIVDLDGLWQEGVVVVARYRDLMVAKRYYGDELRGRHGDPIPTSEADIIGVAIEVNKKLDRRND